MSLAHIASARPNGAEVPRQPALRPWRPECRRRDVVNVGRFEFERALRRGTHDLSAGAVAVLMVLASYGDKHGRNIFPSQQTLATACRRSERHVRAKLREATDAGLLRRLSHGGGRPALRNGRAHRVTPARYELTLPPHLTQHAEPQPARSEHTAESAFYRVTPPKAPSGPRRQEGGLSGVVLDAAGLKAIRDAAGVPSMTEQQAHQAVDAALRRADGEVRHPLRYAAEVIRRDRAYFRPVPDVVEPPCPRHPEHPSTRCPACRSSRTGPTPEWRRLRERLRRSP